MKRIRVLFTIFVVLAFTLTLSFLFSNKKSEWNGKYNRLAFADELGTTENSNLSETKFNVSAGGSYVLLATAIKDTTLTYEVGYIIDDFEFNENDNHENTKVYSSITFPGQDPITAKDIFGDEYEGCKMIVWELHYSYTTELSAKAYYINGVLIDNVLTKDETDEVIENGLKEITHTHTWGDGEVTTPATCTEKGVKTFTCACGETKTEEVDALGHDYQHVDATTPTHDTFGCAEHYECSRCHALALDGEGTQATTAEALQIAKLLRVTFDTDGGSEIAYQDVPVGTTAAALADFVPTKTGYTFSKWMLVYGEQLVDIKSTDVVPQDITVKAIYTINTYTVIFKNDDGTELQNSSIEYGTLPAYTDTLVYSDSDNYNYVFLGWDKEIVAVTENVTYTATYTTTKKKILTVEDFNTMATIKTGYYELGNDIDFTGKTISNTFVWNGNDEFKGTFDGKGYALTGILLSNSLCSVIGANEGTIKNVYVELETSEAMYGLSNNYTGFVGFNAQGGVVTNVYSKLTVKHNITEEQSNTETYNTHPAAVVGGNFGTISSCVGQIEIVGNITANVAIICGYNRENSGAGLAGSVYNCFGITNVSTCNIVKRDETQTTANCEKYADVLFLVEGDVVKASNGFDADLWTISNDELFFNEKQITSNGITVLNQDNIDNFASLINSNLSGYFVLGSDLDFDGITPTKIGAWDDIHEFTGTLDGRGHTIKNYNISNSVQSVIFANKGTIKNIKVELYTTESVGVGHVGFVSVNCEGGLISNVVSTLYLNHNTDSDAYGMRTGCIVGSVKGGRVQNCIGEVVINSSVSLSIVGLIAGWNEGNSVIENCAGITYGRNIKIAKSNSATINNSNLYDDFDYLAQSSFITSQNGFSKYITSNGNNVLFNNKAIANSGATILTQANIDSFFATIDGNHFGYYVLGEDLDFSGVQVSTIGKVWSNNGTNTEFLGVFDGKGHSMVNISLTQNNSAVFGYMAGTVRNVYVEMSTVEDIIWTDDIGRRTGFIGGLLSTTEPESTGLVSNVYCKLYVNHEVTGDMAAAIVGRVISNNKIESSIGEVVLRENISANEIRTIQSFGAATIVNSYGISNSDSVNTTSSIKDNYTNAQGLISNITESNGFNMNYWNTDDNVLKFGSKTIA